MTPEAWAEMTGRISGVETRLTEIHRSIGEMSQDGKGGSGLSGEIARLQRDVSEIIALKNQGIGLIIAVSIFGVLIVLGIRQWIGGVIGGHP